MSTQTIACPACGLDLGVAQSVQGFDDDVCPACGHGHWFWIEPIGDVQVVHLKGRGIVTEQNVMRVLERMRSLIHDRGYERILLDFEGVTYLSSTILARLINLARFAAEHRSQLKLGGVRPDVQDIFRIARLESFFDVYPTQEKALGGFLRPVIDDGLVPDKCPGDNV